MGEADDLRNVQGWIVDTHGRRATDVPREPSCPCAPKFTIGRNKPGNDELKHRFAAAKREQALPGTCVLKKNQTLAKKARHCQPRAMGSSSWPTCKDSSPASHREWMYFLTSVTARPTRTPRAWGPARPAVGMTGHVRDVGFQKIARPRVRAPGRALRGPPRFMHRRRASPPRAHAGECRPS